MELTAYESKVRQTFVHTLVRYVWPTVCLGPAAAAAVVDIVRLLLHRVGRS